MDPRTSDEALQQLQGFQKNRRSSQDILGEAEGRLGLPSAQQRLTGLRGAISNTENLLRGVEGSVTGRTSGSLVTEAQRNRLVSLERQPLSDQFREESRALEGEQANLSELTGRAMTQAQMGLGEQSSREQYLKNIYDTLFGRETADREEKRWWEDFNERKRQSDLQARQMQSQTDLLRRQIQAALSTPTLPSGGGGAGAGSGKAIYNKAGQIAGYDTPTQSFLTPEGQKQEDAFWKKRNAPTYSFNNLLGNLGGIAGSVGKTVSGGLGGLKGFLGGFR